MKLIARILLILVFSYMLSFYLPWWILLVIAFLAGFALPGNGINIFISGFLGGGLLWMTYSWYLDFKTESILSQKVVGLFPVDDHFLLILASGIVGALCGAFGCLAGNSFRQLFMKKKKKSFYS